jgi:hypothetical protein
VLGDEVKICNIDANDAINTRRFREFVAKEGATFVFHSVNQTLSTRTRYSEMNAVTPLVSATLVFTAKDAIALPLQPQDNTQRNRLMLLGTKTS